MVKNPVTISAALIALAALLLFGGAAQTALAQTPDRTPNVEVSVDRTEMTMTDVLTLTLKVEGIPDVSPPPPPPSVIGLVLIGRNTIAKRSFVNGVMVSQFEFQFKYRAARTGKIEIEPRKVVIGSDVYVTDPIEINVTAAPMPSAAQLPALIQPSSLAGQDLFAEADVNDSSPYIGEQIVHAIRYYSTTNNSRPVYNLPDYAGFWNPEETILGEDVVSAAGRRYIVKETRTILFPTLAGNITIEPTTVTAYSDATSGRVNLATRQIALNVRPLPPNDPSAFTGAVGKYDITADIDADSVAVGEPITLTVTIGGEGNVELLPAPDWPPMPAGWRAFDNDVSFTAEVSDGKVQGSKTFKRMLVPDAPGSYDLPPIEYAYFDPNLEEYVAVSAESFSVEAVSAPGAEPVEPIAASVAEEPEPDIRYIKPAPQSMKRGGDSPVSGIAFRALWLAPLAALAAVIAWLLLTRRMRSSSNGDEEPGAGELALVQLAAIEPGASSADAAGAALRGYLTAALDSPTSGLTAAAIARNLTERGVSSETTELLRQTLARIDEMRFSPRARDESEDVGRDVAELVRRLDEELAE